jgi:hypothetical protein
VQLRDMKTGVLTQLDSGKASYQNLAWTEKGEAFSLIRAAENKGYKDKRCTVLAVTEVSTASPKMTVFDPANDAAFPKGMVIATSQTPSLSEDLGTVFFGIRTPRKEDSPTGRGFDKKADPTKGMLEMLAKAGEREKPDLVIWVELVPHRVFGDVAAVQPHLVAFDAGVGVLQVGDAGAQALHLRAGKHDAAL